MATNNAIDLSAQGVCYYNGAGSFTGIDGSTATYVLTSNGTGVAPSFKSAGSSGIGTINGDSGSITGSTVTIFANNAGLGAGSSVLFVNSGTTSTLQVTDSNDNTIIGLASGKAGISGTSSASLGNLTLAALTSGSNASAFGSGSLQTLTSGNNNSALGHDSLQYLITGSNVLGVGANAGSAYIGAESNNIVIGNAGVSSESNVIRIGTQGSGAGQQNTCFVAGISGVTVSNTNMVTINTSTGQLGSQAVPSSGVTGPVSSTNNAIATWNGTGGTALFSPPSPLVSSAGVMTNSNQPCFQATFSAGAANVTGDGTTYQVPFDTVVFDNDSNFTTGASAHFTAPVTGRYMLAVQLSVGSITSANYLIVDIVTTSKSYTPIYIGSCTMTGSVFCGTVIANMSATDTAYVTVSAGGGLKVAGIQGSTSNNGFYGYLVC